MTTSCLLDEASQYDQDMHLGLAVAQAATEKMYALDRAQISSLSFALEAGTQKDAAYGASEKVIGFGFVLQKPSAGGPNLRTDYMLHLD